MSEFEKIILKYGGLCLVCKVLLHKGEVVLFKKGTGVKHLLCQSKEDFLKGEGVF
ncbi:hypothetical protein [Nitrosopumilus sp. S6]